MGCCDILRIERTRSGEMPISAAISSATGSRPSSCTRRFCERMKRLIVSIMWTGMRIVRAWSAMARVAAWRIHQVA